MPRYQYRCPRCSTVSTLRRDIGEMDDPAECLLCGTPMARQFTPTNNIFVPGHFAYTWSDFHDETEKELAKNPNVEKAERWFSQPGRGRSSKR